MFKRKWISSFLVGLLIVFSFSPVVQAEEDLTLDAPAASSNKAEPTMTVGPEGKTILANEETTKIGPGMGLTTFERFDARGWVNGEMMTIDIAHDAVSADLLFPGVITDALPVSELTKQAGAVAGVNGDFFDINNTKAPLGTMIHSGSLLKGPQGSHTLTAGVDQHGIGQISDIFLDGTVQLPSGFANLSTFNQSSIPVNGIGLYTSVWGQAERPSTDTTFEVEVRNSVVVSTSSQTGSGSIAEDTFILVGRENGAIQLQELSVGDEVSITYEPRVDGDSLMDFAIGGNMQLVENGVVTNGLDDSTTAPRTAVGFSEDGQTMILVVVDGRQTESRGMTLKEMGELMTEYGAYQALNIDGGGSSTMVARMPGKDDAEVVNNPSDGSERSVPNGIGIFVEGGSGELKNFAVETMIASEHSNRVFPGLSRSFVGLGYDENFSPVAVDSIKWKALPGRVGSFNEDGVFTARISGQAEAQAQIREAKGTMNMTVLGELDRIEATQSYIGLEMGRTASFSINGFDKDGYIAPIEPRDMTIAYDEEVIMVQENSDGSFTVTPKQDGGSTAIKLSILDKVLHLPVTVGLETVAISDFETMEGWDFTKYPEAVGADMQLVDGRNGKAIELSYDFSTTTATRAAYLQASPLLELPGDVQNIGLWVHGDGNGAWLRTVLEDATGTRYTLTLANEVNWTGWKYVETTLPEGIQYPANLWRIYPVETNQQEQYAGQLIFDYLTVKVPPSIEHTGEEEITTDSLIIQNDTLGNDTWQFAVLNDSQFVAASPNSQQVQMVRKALREIVAADPEFLVINGDFVDTAWEEDFEFAKQILDEEVGDAFPIYYTPGNHEIVGSGSLDNFLAVFGQNRYNFDYKGTRFIFLDSSTGSFRTSDFDQMIELKQSLDEAATDPSINNVVVFGHHPTRDPLPTKNSQLSDRKEAELIENWLTEYREVSRGKGAIYISGHAHTVHLERVEGVPYMVTASAGKAPYGSSDDGGFYAWTMFGVDERPIPNLGFGPEHAASPSKHARAEWIQAEVRPILESISINAPESVSVSEKVVISAEGNQAGGLSFPLRYPASVMWEGSENVFLGTGTELDQAKLSRRYAAIFDLESGELTALRRGEISLEVIANEVVKEVRIELE
ncbi:phosphodiester glycosidase family protein [Paucisalibacillus globulus]|uniref:phosphodiester glycosidase family protein n=1 Tax=Paucisalibacillus globulus TaxID=351095 RepID=UPI00041961B4|nr:phosphodiester glycosidase family protein [Paucisalibacillus globulus]